MVESERARRDPRDVVQLVSDHTGLTFPPDQRGRIERRIRNVLAKYSPEKVTDYLMSADPDVPVLDALVEELTVGETYFFREPAQFEFIRSTVLPQLIRRPESGREIRAWSAGCASGEEAYSLAMLLREWAGTAAWTVIGTDLARGRLRRARAGEYSRWALRGMSDEWVETNFTRRGNRYQLRNEIRRPVTYRPLNLAESHYPSVLSGIWEMDLVLCRNVLIYLDPATVARIAARLLDSLSVDGWLFLGASDPMLGDLVPCETVMTDAGVAYRRPRRPIPENPLVAPKFIAVPRKRIASTTRRDRAAPPPPTDTPVGAVEEAKACYAARNYERAAELLGRWLDQEQGDAEHWILLVRALANQGQLAEASRACATAIERHPARASLPCLHAVVLGAASKNGESAAAARQALYLERKLVMAHVTLGQAQLRLGDRPGAKRSFLTAERLLSAMDADEIVPDSDGETVARLRRTVGVQLKLLNGPS